VLFRKLTETNVPEAFLRKIIEEADEAKWKEKEGGELSGTGGRRLKNLRELVDLLIAAGKIICGDIGAKIISENEVLSLPFQCPALASAKHSI